MIANGSMRPAKGILTRTAERLGDTISFWGVLAFGVFLLFVTSWVPAARALRTLKTEERAVRSEIGALKEENAKLENRLNALYSDPYYVERVLRQELGFLPPGEKVLKAGGKKDGK
jgi:cell division protein FtsB